MTERLLSTYITLVNRIESAVKDEDGQTMVEYALVIALLVIAIAAVFTASGLDTKVSSTLSKLAASFK